MDANCQIDPVLRPYGRIYRACTARAVADWHRSCGAGRSMSLPNVRRLFERRWHLAVRRLSLPATEAAAVHAAGLRRGRRWLTDYYALNLPSPTAFIR